MAANSRIRTASSTASVSLLKARLKDLDTEVFQAAAASEAKHEYHMDHTFATFCFVTLCDHSFLKSPRLLTHDRFLLGQSVGTILFPPWSESFGRKNVYIFSSALSCTCCGIIGGVHSLPVAIVMRIIAGLLSAVPCTIVGGSIEDMFDSQARIWVVFCWTVASNIGLIIGPIMSSHIIEVLDWYVSILHSFEFS